MEKIEKINTLTAFFSTLFTIAVFVTGCVVFLTKQNLQIQFIVLFSIATIILAVCIWILWLVILFAFPRKPRLIKAFNAADTYIYYHGEWRRIPDWETRDYLAHVLGFRPGEEDIIVKSKEYVDSLRKGPPLESIFTYSRDKQNTRKKT